MPQSDIQVLGKSVDVVNHPDVRGFNPTPDRLETSAADGNSVCATVR
jgi:hypothetical protein